MAQLKVDANVIDNNIIEFTFTFFGNKYATVLLHDAHTGSVEQYEKLLSTKPSIISFETISIVILEGGRVNFNIGENTILYASYYSCAQAFKKCFEWRHNLVIAIK